jgi:hypothetical protein
VSTVSSLAEVQGRKRRLRHHGRRRFGSSIDWDIDQLAETLRGMLED